MCEREETLCGHLEIKVAQIGHTLIITLVCTQFIKLDCLVVILDCLAKALLKAQSKIVQGTVAITCLSEAVHCFFIFFRMIKVEGSKIVFGKTIT